MIRIDNIIELNPPKVYKNQSRFNFLGYKYWVEKRIVQSFDTKFEKNKQ